MVSNRNELMKKLWFNEDQSLYRSLIITLCGPIRLWDKLIRIKQIIETMDVDDKINYIFTPVKLKGDNYNKELKEHLIQLHKDKINMSDYVVIIGKKSEWGKDTLNEIEYAKSLDKHIIYFEEYKE